MARLHALREEDAHALAEVRERGLEPGGFARMDRLATAAENVRNHETFIRDELERAATWPDHSFNWQLEPKGGKDIAGAAAIEGDLGQKITMELAYFGYPGR
ncbi:hypothetical protein PG996_013290 [Apiospora saccharicola]|uniref:GNAT family N-acetyltransferase n=1 Tax=Apiospora saccharicola TaxID=335842 RepID=A0ABR1U7U6_9PEZI